MKQINKNLSQEQYNVCFLKGTEPPGSGKYLHNKEPGMYVCVNCGQMLFSSDTKYDSSTGWPSFWETATDSVKKIDLEVVCSNCGAHLGHVFDDGPAPTGKRYCINSLALDFRPR